MASVIASVSVVSMGACGILYAGSFKEVVAKWFIKTGIDDVSLVLIIIDVLVEFVMKLGGASLLVMVRLVILLLDKLVTV